MKIVKSKPFDEVVIGDKATFCDGERGTIVWKGIAADYRDCPFFTGYIEEFIKEGEMDLTDPIVALVYDDGCKDVLMYGAEYHVIVKI